MCLEIKKEITDYHKDGIKIGVIAWVKEINEFDKLVSGIEIFAAHAVEMEMDSRGEYESVDSVQVCIKVWFL